jgi:hypothetical protein
VAVIAVWLVTETIMPIRIYGLTEFAVQIPGMDRKKMSVYYSREKLPEPFAVAGDRPFWTIEQINEYKSGTTTG